MEDELPDYDADEEDEEWLEKFNKDHPDKSIHMLDLERIFDTLEKSCSSRIDVRIFVIILKLFICFFSSFTIVLFIKRTFVYLFFIFYFLFYLLHKT